MTTNVKIDVLLQELEARKASFGSNHITVVETLNAIGLSYNFAENDYDKALYYHQSAFQILVTKKTNARQLVDISTTLSDIGNCHMALDDLLMARRVFLQAKTIMDRSKVSAEHPRCKMLSKSIQYRLEHINRSTVTLDPSIKRCKSSMFESYSSSKRSIPMSSGNHSSSIDMACLQLKHMKNL